jgi:Flp pilus assembly protein TadD
VRSWWGGLLAATILTAAAGAQAANQPVKPAADKGTAKSSAKSASATVDSLALLEKAVARDSMRYENVFALGMMYLDRDRPNEATRLLERATTLRPKEVAAWVNLGAAYDAAGSTGAAQERYRKALTISPGDSIATCRLASSLYATGKQTDAVNLLRELMRDKPRSFCAYFTMGVAFADAGIYREAIRMWRKVIELAPDSPEAASARESIEVLEKFVGI